MAGMLGLSLVFCFFNEKKTRQDDDGKLHFPAASLPYSEHCGRPVALCPRLSDGFILHCMPFWVVRAGSQYHIDFVIV
jgi:hypothetical protein